MQKAKNSMDPRFRKRMIILCICFFMFYFLSIFPSGNCLNLFSVYLPQLHGWENMDIYLPSTIGGLISVPLMFTCSLFIAKKGPMFFLTASMLLVGVCMAAIGFTDNLIVYQVCYILVKVGYSVYMFAALCIINNWFVTMKGRILGFVTIAAPLAQSCDVAATTALTEKFGFHIAMLAVGVLICVVGLLPALLLKNTPQQMGLYPDGASKPVDVHPETETHGKPQWTLRRIFTDKNSIFCIFTITVMMLVMSSTLPHFMTRFTMAGFETPQILGIMAIGSFVAMPVSYLLGWIDDRFGTPKAALIIMFFCVAQCVAMTFVSSGNMVMVILAVAGMAALVGGVPNVSGTLMMYVYGQKNYTYCSRWGFNIMNLIACFGVSIMSACLEGSGSFTPALTAFGILSVISMIMMFFVKNANVQETAG